MSWWWIWSYTFFYGNQYWNGLPSKKYWNCHIFLNNPLSYVLCGHIRISITCKNLCMTALGPCDVPRKDILNKMCFAIYYYTSSFMVMQPLMFRTWHRKPAHTFSPYWDKRVIILGLHFLNWRFTNIGKKLISRICNLITWYSDYD